MFLGNFYVFLVEFVKQVEIAPQLATFKKFASKDDGMNHDDNNDTKIEISLHQSQFDALYQMFLTSFFEGDTKRMVDVLYRTVKVPFRNKGDQFAVIVLDKRRQGVVAAFLIKMRSGGNIESMQTIPLSLTINEKPLSELFKVKSTEFPQAVLEVKSLIEAHFGPLWTLLVLDFIHISKIYNLFDFEFSKQLLGKVIRRTIDLIKEEKIKLTPIPEVITAIERII